MSNFGNDYCKQIVENVCPYCNEHLIMNKRSFANHVRWCKANPRYDEILQSTRHKLLLNAITNPVITEHVCNCEICGNEYTVNVSQKHFNDGKYKKTCSNKCAKKLTVQKTNKEERNKKIKQYAKENVHAKEHFCKYCGNILDSRKKVFCSDSCKLEFRLKNKEHKQIYKHFCKFTFALNQYPSEFDFNLINTYGWYKAKNHGDNPEGISRDHCYSIDKGFENLIDPYIISHPANCILIQQRKNATKYTKCDIDINDLINKIKLWNNKYGVYQNKIDYAVLRNLGLNFNVLYDE